MPVVGALAAAFALFATQVEPSAGASREQARMFATRLVVPAVPGGAYVSGLVEAISPSGPSGANGPARDGMSLRDLRPNDLSGQTTIPFVAGRF